CPSLEETSTRHSEDAGVIDKVLYGLADGLDQVSAKINISNFNLFFLLLLAIYILCAFIQYLRGRLLIYVAKNIDTKLGEAYYKRIIDMSASCISERKTGEYLSRFSDLSSIRNAISGATITIILDSLMVLFCGVVLFMLEKVLFFISLSLAVFYAVVAVVFKKPLENSNRELMENNAVFESYLKEGIDGNELIKASCSQKHVKSRLNTLFSSFIDSTVRNGKAVVAQDTLCNAIECIGMVVILWVGFYFVNDSKLTLGALLTFYSLRAYFTEPIKNIISLQPTIQTALVAADRYFDILDMEAEKIAGNDTVSIKPDWKKIAASGLSFEYRNRDVVLDNMSLEVNRGEKIALIGESGCGKTTFAKLMLNLFDPTGGDIFIDDVPYRNISKDEIRRNIAYVSQEMFFFTDSVRNNLILGNTEIDDSEIMRVCSLCKIDEFINELPYGLDTPIEEGGNNLSAGQKQRLALVRAILQRPKLLILDEITSNLDIATENGVKDFIFNHSDLTCIMIAHRLSTIKQCNRIYVMKNGTVAESGSHTELMNKKGLYYNMVQAQ
ncbi:MAG: peptidase domain-containing ABC transporter, partial [Lachnospiraceae bacterium]